MTGGSGTVLVRLAVLGAAVVVLVGVLSFGAGDECVLAAVVLGVAALAAGVLGALASRRR